MESRKRRAVDRPRHAERRGGLDRRTLAIAGSARQPSWEEQKVQFLTRFFIWGLGLAFFNLADGIAPVWTSLATLNLVYASYCLLQILVVVHASRQHNCMARFRLAMWVDIGIVSFSVLNDPYTLPPSLLVFIMVVLGNGMRYGMRLFAEALIGSMVALLLVFGLRYSGSVQELTPGWVFLNLFGAFILIYSYILMGRIESNRLQLEQHSRLDILTGLMNRRALYEYSDHMFNHMERHDSPLVVMLADLDRFKSINDSYGHAKGDEVLQAFADILRNSIRGADIAARLGGDEFVLMLPDTDLAHAEVVAQRIQQEVRQYAEDTGLDFGTTIAFGAAPDHGTNLQALLHRVDSALYESKGNEACSGIRRVQATPGQAELAL